MAAIIWIGVGLVIGLVTSRVAQVRVLSTWLTWIVGILLLFIVYRILRRDRESVEG
jgi:hypothetical protein